MTELVEPGTALGFQPPAIAEAVTDIAEADEAAIGAQAKPVGAKGRLGERGHANVVGFMETGAGAEIDALERLRRDRFGQQGAKRTG